MTRKLNNHSDGNIVRAQLRTNGILGLLDDQGKQELESMLSVVDCSKGEYLLLQGVHEMEQYFILDGILKRVVANPEGKEMILRFAAEQEMETSYAAWCLKTPTPYSIQAVTKARVAKLPLPQWVEFMQRHAAVRDSFEFYVMSLMSEIMAHTITLHLLDAPGRVHRFMRKYPHLLERLPKKEQAAYLNLSAETLSRLKKRGKI